MLYVSNVVVTMYVVRGNIRLLPCRNAEFTVFRVSSS